MRSNTGRKTLSILFSLIMLCRVGAESGLQVRTFNNSALIDPAISDFPWMNGTASVELTGPGASSGWSAEVLGTVNMTEAALSPESTFVFDCEVPGADGYLVWLDDHLVCQSGLYNLTGSSINRTDGSVGNPLLLLRKELLVLRVHAFASTSSSLNVSIRWSDSGRPFTEIPLDALSPSVSAAEASRASNARSLGQGWAAWNHYNMLDLVLAPQGSRVNLGLCRISDPSDCISRTTPGGTNMRAR